MSKLAYLDTSEFNKTLEKYLELSRKELVDEVNRRAANVCARAINLTPRANPDKIVRDMKAIETVKASYIKKSGKEGLSKGGKTTQGKRTIGYMGKPEAFKIANWRLKRGKALGFYRKFPNSFAGPGKGKTGGTASAFYDRFVTTHRSSSGYIAAGWLRAYNTFKMVVKNFKTAKEAKPNPQILKGFAQVKGSAQKGYGKPAQLIGDVFRAVFANAADGVEDYGVRALEDAIRLEEIDMKNKIEEWQQELLNKLARS